MENLNRIKLPTNVLYILVKLERAGYEAYAVGGCVRDALLGLPINDYDITTNATPQEVVRVFEGLRIIETGLQHGTVTVMVGDTGFEVTTFRVDGEYLDHRHPESVQFTSQLKEDLSRRDFTINAMAADKYGNVIDYFNGKSDLSNKLIRCVGNPDKRFNEDGLRMLRALRFASRLGFDIEKETAEAIHFNRDLLNNISAERIQKEFNGIINCKNSKSIPNIIKDYFDVFTLFIPHLSEQRMNQNNKYHIHNLLLDHTLAVTAGVRNNLVLRLAAFFHDFGKPACYSEEVDVINQTIQGHFYGHPDVSAEIAKEIMTALKYSCAEIDAVVWLVQQHDNTIASTTRSVKRLMNKAPSDELFNLLLELKASDRADHINLNEKYPENLDEVRKIKQSILESQSAFSLSQLDIDGDDIMSLGFKGPDVGRILNRLLDAVIDEDIVNKKDNLINLVIQEEKLNG